eukprot:TRINITY_DN81384_c0_g1_i1.p1 TRINITY_DN81384_c0_g1~~TRINITY_DN81384_c0_g1_i1.p1  ORF type:complete len:191 (-),score=27.27 TRINITY_DN81384_c0_g1_i1:116-688(-)
MLAAEAESSNMLNSLRGGLGRALSSPQGGLIVFGREQGTVAAAQAEAAAIINGASSGGAARDSAGSAAQKSGYPQASTGSTANPVMDGPSPDPTRGFSIDEYGSIWKALSNEKTWPSVQRFSVVGPMGDEFAGAVQAKVSETLGRQAENVAFEPRKKWQSVRLDVRCESPDDFCALHSGLKSLDGVKFLL